MKKAKRSWKKDDWGLHMVKTAEDILKHYKIDPFEKYERVTFYPKGNETKIQS